MYNKICLPNGVRIVTEHMDGVRSAAIGVWVGAGSRFEKPEEAGSAHFIEHMLFKGTSRHSAAELAQLMDAVGGQVNAYTTRDSTCFYARVLDSHLPLTIDLLSDMFFDSNFAPQDVGNELGVILEEIDMYEDSPEDVAVEQLMLSCFPGALGRPVLGAAEVLERQTGASLRAFMESHYTAPRIVVTLAGSFSDADVDLISRRFSVLPGKVEPAAQSHYYVPAFAVTEKQTEQNQLIIGFPGLSVVSEERFALVLLSGILGGNASSRLFQTVREEHGLCYSITTFTAAFAETGMLAVSAAMGRETEAQAAKLIMEELRRFRDEGVTQEELDRARGQVKASMLMSLESTASRMNRLGNGELYRGSVMSVDEVTERYDAITRAGLHDLIGRLVDFDKMSLSAVGSVGGTDYYRELLK